MIVPKNERERQIGRQMYYVGMLLGVIGGVILTLSVEMLFG